MVEDDLFFVLWECTTGDIDIAEVIEYRTLLPLPLERAAHEATMLTSKGKFSRGCASGIGSRCNGGQRRHRR
jgi:hypothetical protein